MFPFIELSKSIRIPLYSMCFILAFIISVAVCMHNNKQLKDDILYSSIYAAIGIGIGAKVFYFFTVIPIIIFRFDSFVKLCKLDLGSAVAFLFGGLVFYGGLIGAIAGVYIYCRRYKVDINAIFYEMIPFIPFVHAFGRVGCFFAGCCYGIEYHGIFAIHFPYSKLIPKLNAVPRFPIQLLEAIINLLLFILLLQIRKRINNAQTLLSIYVVSYATIRFFDEFLRGDSERGHFGIISTSQIISLILIAAIIITVIVKKNLKKTI